MGVAVAVTVTPGTVAVACTGCHWAASSHTQVGTCTICQYAFDGNVTSEPGGAEVDAGDI